MSEKKEHQKGLDTLDAISNALQGYHDFKQINPLSGAATPEEKYWAMQVIKHLLGNARVRPKVTIKRLKHSKEYIDAYNAIIRRCGSKGSCSVEDILDILGDEAMSAIASESEELE